MWRSNTKTDLIIEVWEKLDCENVGAAEIQAIETVIADRYGKQAVDSPMRIARLLADEGAELRHSEIMALWVKRGSEVSHGAEFRNLSRFSNFTGALSSIKNYEALRKRFLREGDKQGLRALREEALAAKTELLGHAGADESDRSTRVEMAEWITIWLQSPEIFENWIILRQSSPEFIAKFGKIEQR